jgi:hypothetical protein
MRPRIRTITLAVAAAIGGLTGTGARETQAQVFLSTPGFAVGVGAPVVGAYPIYPAYGYGVVPPLVGAYPVPVRPYPYVYGRPGVYGPRPYAPYYARPGYGYHRR